MMPATPSGKLDTCSEKPSVLREHFEPWQMGIITSQFDPDLNQKTQGWNTKRMASGNINNREANVQPAAAAMVPG